MTDTNSDPVNHPEHYTSDPSGVECITITRHRNFNIGNAIKYLWRAGLKADADQTARQKHVEDLRKAVFYINDEITRLGQATVTVNQPPPTKSLAAEVDRVMREWGGRP